MAIILLVMTGEEKLTSLSVKLITSGKGDGVTVIGQTAQDIIDHIPQATFTPCIICFDHFYYNNKQRIPSDFEAPLRQWTALFLTYCKKFAPENGLAASDTIIPKHVNGDLENNCVNFLFRWPQLSTTQCKNIVRVFEQSLLASG